MNSLIQKIYSQFQPVSSGGSIRLFHIVDTRIKRAPGQIWRWRGRIVGKAKRYNANSFM